MTLGRFRSPHCGEDGIPRWLGAFSSSWFPARCEHCFGKARVSRWVMLPGAVIAALAPISIFAVAVVSAQSTTAAYALAAAGFLLLALPPWLVPLRRSGRRRR